MSKVFGLYIVKHSIFSKLPWELHEMIISYLKSSQLSYILHRFPNKKLNWFYIPEENIELTVKLIPKNHGCWRFISSDIDIPLNIIKKYPNKEWPDLSYNINITTEFIKNNLDKDWNWNEISSKVTMEFIKENPDKPWDWKNASTNPNITPEFIEKHIDKKWDWWWISRNHNLTFEFITKFSDKNWNLSNLILNPCLSTKDKLYICELR